MAFKPTEIKTGVGVVNIAVTAAAKPTPTANRMDVVDCRPRSGPNATTKVAR